MSRKKKYDALNLEKKKRKREKQADNHGPPQKKQATSQSIGDHPYASGMHGSSQSTENIPINKYRKVDGTDVYRIDANQSPTSTVSIQEKSGYESLGLLEEALMDPSRVYVPSSLPSDNTRPQTGADFESDKNQDYFLPDLPEIKDPHYANAPFTHQGTLGCTEHAQRNKFSLNYERLEFLGDAYLELIASRVILPRFPNFPPGRLSQTRQLLVCNETLARFAESYGFDTRARLPAEITRKRGNQEKGWIKAMGDIFEAYVAALIISDPTNGHSVAEKWLAELWEPLLRREINPESVDPMAKQTLAQKIMTKGTKIHYRDADHPKHWNAKGQSTFFIKAFYTGLGYTDFFLGSGKGLSKPEAGLDAATQALQHPRLAEIIAKKKEFDAKSKAEREQQQH